MSVGVTLEELLAWNEQSADFWKAHLDANPALLELPCDIGGTPTCRSSSATSGAWSCAGPAAGRTAGDRPEKLPAGPLDALFDLHRQAVEIFRNLLAAPEASWSDPTFSISSGFPRRSEPFRGERWRRTRSSTASATGRNWRHWCAQPASPPSSGATCSSVLRCARFRGRLQLPLLLKAGAAEHRPALRGLERNRGFRAALRAGGPRLRAYPLRSPRRVWPCTACSAWGRS